MTDTIVSFMGEHGYLAIFVLMVVENIFPPIPSEVILPYVGHLAATGELNVFVALLTAAAGSLLGTSFWFAFGWFLSVSRLKHFFSHFGGYIAITVNDFEYAAKFFERHERSAVFFGRMIPAVRSVISIPAGSVGMNPGLFILISLVGIFIWNSLLIAAGFMLLTDVGTVETYINPISDLILLGFAGAYIFQVIRFVRSKRSHIGDS